MRIEQFDPEAEGSEIETCYQLFEAARPVDDPDGPPYSGRFFRHWWIDGHGSPRETWLARAEAGEPLGCFLLGLPDLDNTDAAHLTLLVAADQRRAGIGTSLLEHACARARAAGRRKISDEARLGSPGEMFARARGAAAGIVEVRRVLDLNKLAPETVRQLRSTAEAAASGYSLVHWQGPASEEHLRQCGAIDAAMADAPRDPGSEPWVWNLDRARRSEQRAAARGLRWYSIAARHDQSGDLTALTVVTVDPDIPDWGFQEITAVTRPHRGHRLGLLIKTAMLEWVRELEPGMTRIVTGNAADNRHMIGINEALGFEVTGEWRSWRLDLEPAAVS